MRARIAALLFAAAAAASCADQIPPLNGELTVEPNAAPDDRRTMITIRGEALDAFARIDFSDPASALEDLHLVAALDGALLEEVQMVERGVVTAVVPARLPLGAHTLSI